MVYHKTVLADLLTPVSAYLKVAADADRAFLLESVEGGEKIARYSFIGVAPRAEYIVRGNEVELIEGERRHLILLSPGSDPTHFLHAELRRFQLTAREGLPRFIGGLVGYLGFESVRYFEPTLAAHAHASSLPDGIFLLTDTIVAFDHARLRAEPAARGQGLELPIQRSSKCKRADSLS